jgi:hypothetical protein
MGGAAVGANGGCVGGQGGSGGSGGGGGGGAGGVSAGVLYKGPAPAIDATTTMGYQQGQPGAKGPGGAPGTDDGIAGVTGAVVAAP